MAFENYVGRVGGLAVALGVGAAMATGWSCSASAEESSGSAGPSTSTNSSTDGPSTAPASSGRADAGGAGGADKDTSADGGADKAPDKDSGDGAEKDTGAPAPSESEAQDAADDVDQDSGPAAKSADSAAAQHDSAPTTVRKQRIPSRVARSITSIPSITAVDTTVAKVTEAATPPAEQPDDAVVDATASVTAAAVEAPVTASVVVDADPAPLDEPAAVEPPPVLIAAVYEPVGADSSASTTDPISPIAATTVVAALAAARDELERDTTLRSANVVSAQQSSAVDDTPNVLLIGVDGTNLSRVLANPENANFFQLIAGGTTAAASIVGHTTLSNPSWTAVLTGLWGETTGVINNVYNPAVYDRYPTVFNQLETLDPDIATTAIADWDVVAAIGASGSKPADTVLYVPQVSGDTTWSLTDDAVGDATEAAIAAANPDVANFIFSYFVGVDENGHAHGGASQEYADAIANVDDNLGEILAAVNAWQAITGEQWIIIVVTDHGHMAAQGFGHGFQSPDETSTFVIANGAGVFQAGGVNSDYQIVDVTPTVVTLFGGTPTSNAQGVSLTTLDDATEVPGDDAALTQALEDQIAANSFPPFAEALRLSVRTIFASIPYFILEYIPVQFISNALYLATNFVAQIVARLTGVTGASIFPLLPPALPPLQTPDTGADTLCAVATATGVCAIAV